MEYLMMIGKLLVGFVALMIMIRITGKKELASASPLDVVYSVGLGDLIVDASYDSKVTIFKIVVAILSWTVLIYGLDALARKFKWFGKQVKGTAEVLIMDGEVFEEVREKHRLSQDEVQSLLRQKDVFDLKEVKLGVLEPNGSLSILKK
ncbi:DUF421 domain-containing protein [Bacillaceae bacterium C204]|uniref:DUF421 domain-containing protein n=1 Tax=Neobacillus sp. 204 TaxID=3383351 RepID=UPI00397DFAE3